jgi:aldehyde dehydrogenase (NAD+)
MSNHLKFYIDGTWVDPAVMTTTEVINPATEEAVAEIAMGSAADVDRAVAAARKAFPAYARTTREERLALLTRLLAIYDAGSDEMAGLMTMEMGVASTFSRGAQIALGRAHIETAIDVLKRFQFEELRGETLISKEPIGVCGLIHAMELADEPARRQGRAGARRRLHHGGQAE